MVERDRLAILDYREGVAAINAEIRAELRERSATDDYYAKFSQKVDSIFRPIHLPETMGKQGFIGRVIEAAIDLPQTPSDPEERIQSYMEY